MQERKRFSQSSHPKQQPSRQCPVLLSLILALACWGAGVLPKVVSAAESQAAPGYTTIAPGCVHVEGEQTVPAGATAPATKLYLYSGRYLTGGSTLLDSSPPGEHVWALGNVDKKKVVKDGQIIGDSDHAKAVHTWRSKGGLLGCNIGGPEATDPRHKFFAQDSSNLIKTADEILKYNHYIVIDELTEVFDDKAIRNKLILLINHAKGRVIVQMPVAGKTGPLQGRLAKPRGLALVACAAYCRAFGLESYDSALGQPVLSSAQIIAAINKRFRNKKVAANLKKRTMYVADVRLNGAGITWPDCQPLKRTIPILRGTGLVGLGFYQLPNVPPDQIENHRKCLESRRNASFAVAQDVLHQSNAAYAPTLDDNVVYKEESADVSYVIRGGAKFPIANTAELAALNFSPADIVAVPDGMLSDVPDTPRNGTLLKEIASAAVHVVLGGGKFGIPSADEFVAMGYDWNNIVVVGDGALDQIPTAPDDGAKVVERADNHVHVVFGGARFLLPDASVGNDVTKVPKGTLRSLATTPADGTLLREESSGTTYLIEDSLKRTATAQDFDSFGLTNQDAYVVPNGSLAQMMAAPASVAATGASCVAAFHRLWSAARGDHFYTTSQSQVDSALNEGYIYDGPDGYIYLHQRCAQGLAPLYRMWSAKVKDHFYTTNRAEAEAAKADPKLQYVDEGVAGYVFGYPEVGTLPMHRMWGVAPQDHFYTADPNQVISARDIYHYIDEGVAFYVRSAEWAASIVPPGMVYPAPSNNCYRPFYRMWNGDPGDHFYTTSEEEVQSAHDQVNYMLEGQDGYLLASPSCAPGAVALHRMWCEKLRDHYYTIDDGDLFYALNNPDFGCQYEGIQGYAFASQQPGGAPLYSLYGNYPIDDHYFTIDEGQRTRMMQTFGYVDRGVAAWLPTAVIDPPTPVVEPELPLLVEADPITYRVHLPLVTR